MTSQQNISLLSVNGKMIDLSYLDKSFANYSDFHICIFVILVRKNYLGSWFICWLQTAKAVNTGNACLLNSNVLCFDVFCVIRTKQNCTING